MDLLIRPNWHIAMVHFPIALLCVGVLIEIFSFLGWRRSSFRAAGRWAILLGAIIAVPTTFSGLYALSDGNVLPAGLEELEKTNPIAAETIRDHLWMTSIATAGAMLLVTAWIALSNAWRNHLSPAFKIGLLLVLGLTLVGAHHGGEIVYAHHVGPHNQGPATFPTSLPDEPVAQMLDEALSSMQAHVVVSGFAIALACVCLGWSIRAVSQSDGAGVADDVAQAQRIAAAFSSEIGGLIEQRPARSDAGVNHTPPVRAGRFWLLTLLLAAIAAATGIWYLGVNQNTWDIEQLRRAISLPINDDDPQLTRRFAHAISGAVILADSLLLALLAVVARRNAVLLVLLALPMIAALAAQVWLGVLLVMEGPQGAVTGFGG